MKAVFLDLKSLDDLDLGGLANACDSLDSYLMTEPDQVRKRIADAELVLVNKVVLSRDILESANRLKLICVVATGTNNVDLQAAEALGIAVVNCRNYGTQSVVQHVLSMILALHTRLIDYQQAVRRGDWQKAPQFCLLDYPIRELAGKTLGIVGYGDLGRAVANVATALGMKVVVAERQGQVCRAGRTPFEEVLATADVLTLHCPLSDETHHLIDAQALQSMKKDAFVINVARGGIVDEAALAQALREGQIAGAAADVLSVEPPAEGNPLLANDLENLIVTPHCAWGSYEARQTIVDQAVENIMAFKAGGRLRRVV